MKRLDIKTLLNSSRAVSAEKGTEVYNAIYKEIKQGHTVVLDFREVTDLTTAFLNVAIGHLYNDFTSDILNQHLKLENTSSLDNYLIKKVIQRVKMKKKEDFHKKLQEEFEDGEY